MFTDSLILFLYEPVQEPFPEFPSTFLLVGETHVLSGESPSSGERAQRLRLEIKKGF